MLVSDNAAQKRFLCVSLPLCMCVCVCPDQRLITHDSITSNYPSAVFPRELLSAETPSLRPHTRILIELKAFQERVGGGGEKRESVNTSTQASY